jgi:hypothetical protein
VANRAGRIYLNPPHFLPAHEKQTPILRLCLGYNHSGLWQIPDFVGELASVCGGPEQYRAFAAELAQAMRQGEVDIGWEHFSYYCCPCTLGLSCLPVRVFRSSLKSRLQAVCDRFTEAWDLPAGTLTAEAVGSNSPRPLSEAGLGAIPVDEQGVPMIDNIGQENVISPELLRAGICLSHARLFGMVVYVNGIPAYVSPNTRLAIPYGEHLKVERELQIIDMIDQDFLAWPPLGFSINVRLKDPQLFQLWPRRVDLRTMDARLDVVHAEQDRKAAAVHGVQHQMAAAIMSAIQ